MTDKVSYEIVIIVISGLIRSLQEWQNLSHNRHKIKKKRFNKSAKTINKDAKKTPKQNISK